ncbi:hypothetical protein P7C70_g8516, partial [Phenoliferia sp. Uapishka_3]
MSSWDSDREPTPPSGAEHRTVLLSPRQDDPVVPLAPQLLSDQEQDDEDFPLFLTIRAGIETRLQRGRQHAARSIPDDWEHVMDPTVEAQDEHDQGAQWPSIIDSEDFPTLDDITQRAENELQRERDGERPSFNSVLEYVERRWGSGGGEATTTGAAGQEHEDEQDDEEEPLARVTTSRLWRNDPIDIERQLPTWRRGGRTLFESADEVEFRRRSQAPPPTYRPSSDLDQFRLEIPVSGTASATARRRLTGPRGGGADVDATPNLRTTLPPFPSHLLPGGTSSPSSTSFRSKRTCHLLYCGRPLDILPTGFSFSGAMNDMSRTVGGCGKLICARAMKEVPMRVFEKGKGEEETWS